VIIYLKLGGVWFNKNLEDYAVFGFDYAHAGMHSESQED
jgi:hypothetical protein